jgi:hypothetical protein
MKPGARLGALSLLMKGETLSAGRLWMGSPLDTAGAVIAEQEFAAAASGR